MGGILNGNTYRIKKSRKGHSVLLSKEVFDG